MLFVAVFAISLIANIFLLGYAIKSQRQAAVGGILAEGIVTMYPEATRMEFRRVLRENWSRTLAALRDLHEARRNLTTAASIMPLDEQEVERRMRDVRDATGALQTLMQELLLQALRARHQAGGQS
jgi:uncharacterized membrane protein